MLKSKLRRSARLNINEDPNGREYLADLIAWPRHRLEAWLRSSTVRPHLQLWYRLCISNLTRCNDAIDWINTGAKGYYYREDDLEEDLLLMCLGEGNDGSEYADKKARTGLWITQEIWARTAWRIVQANKGVGQAFEEMVVERPAGAYGFVIQVLCLAFHSVAHRGEVSCYEDMINGVESEVIEMVEDESKLDGAFAREDTESVTTSSSSRTGTGTRDDSADSDFEEKSSRTSLPKGSPAKRKREVDGSACGARVMEEWMVSQRKLMSHGAEAEPEGAGIQIEERCFSGFIFTESHQGTATLLQ